MRMFNRNMLGFLSYEVWGGGPDGDGTDLYADTPRGVTANGKCVDPMIHRQNPDADRVSQFLAHRRYGWPVVKPVKPRINCPVGCEIVEMRLAEGVIRRTKRELPAQTQAPTAVPEADAARSTGANGHAHVNGVSVAVKPNGKAVRPVVTRTERDAHYDPNAGGAVVWSG